MCFNNELYVMFSPRKFVYVDQRRVLHYSSALTIYEIPFSIVRDYRNIVFQAKDMQILRVI